MTSFIAAHWWAWPLAYFAMGALLAGWFSPETKSGGEWLWLLLWPILLCMFIGSMLRNLL